MGLIISSCRFLSLLTKFILWLCYSSTRDERLQVQLHFTANKTLKGQWNLNCRFLLIAVDSRLEFLFAQMCLVSPPFSLSFKSFLYTMTKQSLTLEVGGVPDGITKVFFRDWEQTYIRSGWRNCCIFKGYFCLFFWKNKLHFVLLSYKVCSNLHSDHKRIWLGSLPKLCSLYNQERDPLVKCLQGLILHKSRKVLHHPFQRSPFFYSRGYEDLKKTGTHPLIQQHLGQQLPVQHHC